MDRAQTRKSKLQQRERRFDMNETLRLRKATRADQRVLEDVQRRASLAYEEYREALVAHPDAIAVPVEQIDAGDVVVAERDGAITGFAAIVMRADGDADLDAIFVLPELWKQAIGRVLIGAVEKLALERAARSMHVIANPNALASYKSCGYLVTGESQTQFGVGITMAKRFS